MKNVLLCLMFVCALVSCMGPKSNAAADKVAKMWTDMHEDGIVTPEEQAAYNEAVKEWVGASKEDAENFDWEQFWITLGSAASTAFVGVNVFRNAREKKIWGTPAQPPTG